MKGAFAGKDHVFHAKTCPHTSVSSALDGIGLGALGASVNRTRRDQSALARLVGSSVLLCLNEPRVAKQDEARAVKLPFYAGGPDAEACPSAPRSLLAYFAGSLGFDNRAYRMFLLRRATVFALSFLP